MSASRSEPGVSRGSTRESTETKAFYKTSEFFVWAATVAGILIAALIIDGLGVHDAWRYVTYASIGYMVSRGLAKAGSREPYSREY